MNEINVEQLQNFIMTFYPDIIIVKIASDDLVFEERVKLNCFYCEKYNFNWRCPPRIPNDINYQTLISEFDNAAFVYCDLKFNEKNFSDIRSESSILLHRAMLKLEKFLLDNGNIMCISYIGGSCKLCKTGCGKEKCNNPYLARIPLEATGCNVIKSAQKYNINIKFPVKNHLIRLGLLLW